MTMPNPAGPAAAHSKRLLIAQGALYRNGLVEASSELRAHLHPDALARNALHSVVATASSALGHGFNVSNFSGANLQTMLPLLIGAASLLAKRKALLKPLLIGAAGVAAAIGIVRFASRRKSCANAEIFH